MILSPVPILFSSIEEVSAAPPYLFELWCLPYHILGSGSS